MRTDFRELRYRPKTYFVEERKVLEVPDRIQELREDRGKFYYKSKYLEKHQERD